MKETPVGFVFDPETVTAAGVVEAIRLMASGYHRMADLLLHLLMLQFYPHIRPNPIDQEFMESVVRPHIEEEWKRFKPMMIGANQLKTLFIDLEQILGGRIIQPAETSPATQHKDGSCATRCTAHAQDPLDGSAFTTRASSPTMAAGKPGDGYPSIRVLMRLSEASDKALERFAEKLGLIMDRLEQSDIPKSGIDAIKDFLKENVDSLLQQPLEFVQEEHEAAAASEKRPPHPDTIQVDSTDSTRRTIF